MSAQTGDSQGSFEASADYAAMTASSVSRQAEAVARIGEPTITTLRWSNRILQQVVAPPFPPATAQV